MRSGRLRLLKWLVLATGLGIAAFVVALPSAADNPTGTIAVCLTDSGGNSLTLGHDQAWYQANGGSILYVGQSDGYPVDENGCRVQTLPAGDSVAVWVGYDGTYSQHQTGVVPENSTLRFDFYTTKVTLQYAHSIAFGGPTGDSGWFKQSPATASRELLSDGVTPVHFRLDGTGGASARTTLLWPIATGLGATFDRTLFVVRLLDHQGVGLAGGIVDDYLGGWSYDLGQTDTTGNFVLALPTTPSGLSVAVGYKGTRNQQSQSQAVASVFTFQTALAEVKLEDADGAPLDTGYAGYYAGGWRNVGTGDLSSTGGPTSVGVVSQEMLPGSYSFAMTYNHTRQQLNGIAISGPTTDVVFQTGRLTAYFSQPFYWYNSEFYAFASGTSQEFLPGDIGLQLPVHGCETAKFPIAAGDHLVKTGIVATLADSANHALAGGVATVYAGGWQAVGTTGSNGRTCAAINGKLGNTAVAMVYNGTRQQISQNAQTNGIYAFQTTRVTVELRDSAGNLFDTGSPSYYAGGWHTLADTSGGQSTVEMLPGSYAFAMTYNGTREQLDGVAISGSSTTVTFQTVLVNVEIQAIAAGGVLDIPHDGSASYYAGGWHAITTVNPNNHSMVEAQMLPGTYSFAATYNGTRDQKSQMIKATPSSQTVYFHAVLVQVEIRSHDGSTVLDIPGNGSAAYYAGGWQAITTPDTGDPKIVDAEMLPGTYSFATTYKGTRAQVSQTLVEPNANNQANSIQTVTFQTGEVDSTSGTATSYYAGGWKPFTSGMELLPGTYTFAFTGGPNSPETIHGGSVNTIP